MTGINVVAGATTTTNATLAERVVIAEDNFNDNSISGLWQIGLLGASGNSTVMVAEANQGLRMTLPSRPEGSTGLVYNGVRSVNNYDLRDAYISARVVKIPKEGDAVFSSESVFEVGTDGTHKLQFVLGTDGRAKLRKVIPTPPFSVEFTSFSFSTVTMAYVRIRYKASTQELFFETSPTGADGTWLIRNPGGVGITFNDFSLSNVKVSLNAGSYGYVPSTTTAVFDDFKFAKTSTATARAGEDQTLTQGIINTTTLDGSAFSLDDIPSTPEESRLWSLSNIPARLPSETSRTILFLTVASSVTFPSTRTIHLRRRSLR